MNVMRGVERLPVFGEVMRGLRHGSTPLAELEWRIVGDSANARGNTG
jgi:hypothetical protein